MEKHRIPLAVLLTLLFFVSLVGTSLAWFNTFKDFDPTLSFSAGSPGEYSLYKITCEDDSSLHTVSSVGTVGTDGFTSSDLQFGTIRNLSTLENSNYVYYAVRIPREHGGEVSIGVYYGDVDGDGAHFKIYIPLKDANGAVEKEEDGSIKTKLLEDTDILNAIGAIETEEATFISYVCALSDVAPGEYQSIEEIHALFGEDEKRSIHAAETDGSSAKEELILDPSGSDGDFYYAYIRLEPNISLYKDFIEHLWNNMPFFLAYEIRVTLDVAK